MPIPPIRRSWRFALAGAALAVWPLAASAQTIETVTMTPLVIPANATGTVLLEAAINGAVTQVLVDFAPASSNASTIAAYDDGTHGDRQAGDHIFTAELPIAPILAAMQGNDVHRVAIGTLGVFTTGGRSAVVLNLFADVFGSDIPTRPIVRLSQFAQATDHLVNITDLAFFVGFDPSVVTRDFYQVFGDDYDFVALISAPERVLNRDHFLVQNSVSGDGQPSLALPTSYGSAGRLLGISRFPEPGFFDAASTGFIHELGHQWINFLNFAPLAQGIPHWPLSTMATGVMGYSTPGGEGLPFACDVETINGALTLLPQPNGPSYNDFDLYLMGLLPPDQVRPQTVFVDQSGNGILPCNGQVYTGATQPVTVDDIVAHDGPRTPAAGQAPTHFRVATIFVSQTLLSPETMWLYSWLAERGELQVPTATHSGLQKETDPPFFVATGGRGTIDLSLTLPTPGFTLTPTPASVSVTAGGAANYVVGVMPTMSSFTSAVTLSCGELPAHATCVFTPAQVTPGSTAASAVLTITTQDAPASRASRSSARINPASSPSSPTIRTIPTIPTIRTTPASPINPTIPTIPAIQATRAAAPGRPGAPWGSGALAGALMLVAWRRRRRLRLLALVGAVTVSSLSCGPPVASSNASNQTPNTPAAPATTIVATGTYNITVTGSTASVSATASVSLVVQ